MDPQVAAAIIAGSVGVITVGATVAVQISGRRKTSRDTRETLDRTFAEQREQLDTTLAEQREQLDTTLAEQREQLRTTLAEQRTRTLNERFATAAGQLGNDKPPAVRLAGVYAMAGLADDWPKNRQTCVDVLCAYLRLPHDPEPGEDAAPADQAVYRADREVRHTVIRVITAHLREGAAVPWQGLNFDFTGVVFDGGDFAGARFSDGIVLFSGAKFADGEVSFDGAEFSGGTVSFDGARFSGGTSASTAPAYRSAQSASPAPAFRVPRSASVTPGSSAARSTSVMPSSTAAKSASPAPAPPPTSKSASSAPGSPAARSASSTSGNGHVRRSLAGTANRRRGWCYQVRHERGCLETGTGRPGCTAAGIRQRGQLQRRRVLRRHGQLPQCRVLPRRGRLRPGRVLRRQSLLLRALTSPGGTVDFSGAGDWSFPPAFPWTDTPPQA
jgi:uncharacterized protein YjbI with pentapeptide repeats